MFVGIGSNIFTRWLAPVAILLVVVQLTACGYQEREERKAFIDYLQNTIQHSGPNLPTLSEDQKQKFGNYVNDYAIIFNFSRQLKQSIDNSLTPVLNAIAQIHVPQDYIKQKWVLQQSVGALDLLAQQIQEAQATANRTKAALQQPDDLRAVYHQVYAQRVTQPANALMPVVPVLSSFTQHIIGVGNFLSQQGAQVAFTHSGVQFPTQTQVTQYNSMMTALLDKQQALINAQKFVSGNF